MFWQSVWNGLLVLTHWEAWTLLIFFVVSKFVSLYLFGGLLNDDKSGFGTKTAGCLSWIFGGTVLDGILVAIVVVTLIPIMLGSKSLTDPAILLNMSIHIILSGAAVGLLVLIAGSLAGISNIHGLEVFIQGYIIFILFFPQYVEKYYPEVRLDGIYPGFWYTVGFFIVGLSCAYVIYVIIFAALDWYWEEESGSFDNIILEPTSHKTEKFVSQMFAAQLFLKMAGFLPLFMYAAYIGLQL